MRRGCERFMDNERCGKPSRWQAMRANSAWFTPGLQGHRRRNALLAKVSEFAWPDTPRKTTPSGSARL